VDIAQQIPNPWQHAMDEHLYFCAEEVSMFAYDAFSKVHVDPSHCYIAWPTAAGHCSVATVGDYAM
jgi:hypothetical protein